MQAAVFALFSRTRLLRALKWSLLLIVLLATVLGSWTMVENWRGEKAWAAYRLQAAQKGVKLDLAAFRGAPIPDVDNFAAIPLFKDIFEKPEAAARVLAKVALPIEQKPGAVFGGFPGQSSGDLTVWRDYLVRSKLLDAPGANVEDDVLLALERFSPLLDVLHEAGERPGGQFPVPWDQGFQATCPHLLIIQTAATLRALRLSVHLSKRQSAAAYQEWRDILRMHDAIKSEPSLLAGLVRISLVSPLCSAVRAGLKEKVWNAAELSKMQADLAGLTTLEDYEFTVQSERALLNQHLDRISAAPAWRRYELVKSGPEDVLGAGPEVLWFEPWLGRWMPAGWHRQNQLAANRCIDAQLARVDLALQRFDLSEDSPASDEWLLQRNPRRFCFSFLGSANSYAAVENRYVLAWTAVQLARTAIALEQSAHAGQYPESLEELVPAFLPTRPRELFSDLPFIYRKTGDGRFLLYSRALNQKDDGGKVDLKKGPLKQSDWVWSDLPSQP